MQADFIGGGPQAVRNSMLKEFGQFDPRIVRMISYVANACIGTLGKMLTCCAARLRT